MSASHHRMRLDGYPHRLYAARRAAKSTASDRSSAGSTPQCSSNKPVGIMKQGILKYHRIPKTHPKILGPLNPDASPIPLSSRSQLLSLPPELRLMIWEHALTAPTKTLHYDRFKRRFDVSTIGAGLITTCHLTAIETQYLPLLLNTMVFGMRGVGICIVEESWAFLNFSRRIGALERKLGCVLKVKGVHIGPLQAEEEKTGSCSGQVHEDSQE